MQTICQKCKRERPQRMPLQKEVFGIPSCRSNFYASRIPIQVLGRTHKWFSHLLITWDRTFLQERKLTELSDLVQTVISWISSRNRVRWHICRHAYSCCLVSYLPFKLKVYPIKLCYTIESLAFRSWMVCSLF